MIGWIESFKHPVGGGQNVRDGRVFIPWEPGSRD